MTYSFSSPSCLCTFISQKSQIHLEETYLRSGKGETAAMAGSATILMVSLPSLRFPGEKKDAQMVPSKKHTTVLLSYKTQALLRVSYLESSKTSNQL